MSPVLSLCVLFITEKLFQNMGAAQYYLYNYLLFINKFSRYHSLIKCCLTAAVESRSVLCITSALGNGTRNNFMVNKNIFTPMFSAGQWITCWTPAFGRSTVMKRSTNKEGSRRTDCPEQESSLCRPLLMCKEGIHEMRLVHS